MLLKPSVQIRHCSEFKVNKLFCYIISLSLLLTGLLDVVHDFNYNSASQQLLWTPPFTLSGVPILYYKIKIIAFNALTNSAITNSTLPTLSLPATACQKSLNVIVIPVNAVGEGIAASFNYTYIGG